MQAAGDPWAPTPRPILALCETADALRTKLSEYDDLHTLRGIAKRLADGWAPCVDTLANPTRYGWEDTSGTRASRCWEDFDGRVDPMTPAEVQAIYGTGKETR